jgi:hypothetical protein
LVTNQETAAAEWKAARETGDATKLFTLAQEMAAKALNNRENTQMCFLRAKATPEHAMFFAPDDMARVPGHIYSTLGLAEARISSSCEWCFDTLAKEDIADPDNDHKGGGV